MKYTLEKLKLIIPKTINWTEMGIWERAINKKEIDGVRADIDKELEKVVELLNEIYS